MLNSAPVAAAACVVFFQSDLVDSSQAHGGGEWRGEESKRLLHSPWNGTGRGVAWSGAGAGRGELGVQ